MPDTSPHWRSRRKLYLERRVASGSTWLIELNGNPAGYAVIDTGGTLVELFYAASLVFEPAGLFALLTRAARVETCLYQFFDPRMTKCVTAVHARTEPVAVLFRTILD